MNDIVSDIESDILIFADDTSLMASGTDPAITAALLNRDFVGLKYGKSHLTEANQKI